MTNFKEEATRIAGCRRMDKESFSREIEMALENAAVNAIKDATYNMEVISEFCRIRNEKKLPFDPQVTAITQIVTEFLRSK